MRRQRPQWPVRAAEGPTFIEAKTYRIEGHFVGDPELYRDHAETQKIYHDTDPLKMFRAKPPS